MNKFMMGFFKCLIFTVGMILLVPGLLIAVPYWLIVTFGMVGMIISCIIWLSAFCAGGAHLFQSDTDNVFYIPPSVYRSRND